jgi:tetratricopeptide (TPR) repeat protein
MMHTDFEYQPTRAFRRGELPAMSFGGERVEEVEDQPEAAEESPLARDLALADSLDERGRGDAAKGRYRSARVLHEQAMELRRKHLGEADPRLMASFTWLGEISCREGLIEEARWLLQQAHAIACKRFAPDDLQLAATLHNLAVVTRRVGDLAEATQLGEQALAIKVEHLGWEHPSVARTLCTLGYLAHQSRRRRVALCYFERARTIYEQTEGGVNRGLSTVLVGMARVHVSMGAQVSARFLLERALQIREAVDVTPAQSAGVRALLSEVLDADERTAAHALATAALREYECHESARSELLAHLRQLAQRRQSAGTHLN